MEDMRRDLEEVMAAIRMIDGNLHYLSQRVAWGETCFRQVESSGVMDMADAVRQVLLENKKLKTEFNMLAMRVAALQKDQDEGGSQGSAPKLSGSPLNRKYGN